MRVLYTYMYVYELNFILVVQATTLRVTTTLLAHMTSSSTAEMSMAILTQLVGPSRKP